MPQVDFYPLGATDRRSRLVAACRLAEKAYEQGLKVAVRTASPAETAEFDDLLWTYADGSFVPHGIWPTDPEVAALTPVLVGNAASGTGEWGFALRESFGEYRAPTGVGRAPRNETVGLDDLRADVDRVSRKLGRRLKFVVGKPGLDGHSNGAEQIAARARDAGMDVIYEGIRLTPAEIVEAAREQRAHVVGLSILSGSHLPLVTEVLERMRKLGLSGVPVVVGGIIPPHDAELLKAAGVARIYTPKDYEIVKIMADIVELVATEYREAA